MNTSNQIRALIAIALLLSNSASALAEGVPLKLSLTMEPAPSTQPWTDPAKISYTKSSLQGSGYALNGALTATYQPQATASGNGWWPYASAQWAKNSLGPRDKQQDFRKAELGVAWQLGDDITAKKQKGETWFVYFPKLSFSAGRNELTDLETQRLEGTIAIVSDAFESLRPKEISTTDQDGNPVKRHGSYGFSFLPTIGVYNDDIRDASPDKSTGIKPTGKASGLLGKLQLKWVPSAYIDRVTVAGTALFQRNLSASGIRQEATYKHYRGSINYLLYTPEQAKGLLLLPSISLERVYGEDPYTGFAKQGITTVGLKLISN